MMMQENSELGKKEITTQAGILTELGKMFPNLNRDAGILTQSISSIKDGITGVINNASIFNDELIKASRTLGQSVIFAEDLQNRFADVGINILKIGGSSKEVIEIFKTMTAEMGRTVFLSDKTLLNMSMLKKVGIDDTTIKSFTKLYDTIGGTYDEATEKQMQLANQARSYGLNVGQFMTGVASQLTKINQYGFPNGVKDLGDMVAKSKLLGANMDFAASFADKIMGSPEQAMEIAAQMQTLGGSFSSLADPMELLYLAQNDLAGLNDKLIDATRGIASFNEKTGQFEVSVNERLRLKQVASAFGQDASKIIETATKLAKQEEITKRLDFSQAFKGISPEQQQLIASYAQISKGGKVTIEGKGIEQYDTNELLKIVTKIQGGEGSQFDLSGTQNAQDANIRMIQSNMSAMEKVTTAQNTYNQSLSLVAVSTDQFKDKMNQAVDQVSGFISTAANFKQFFGETIKKEVAGETFFKVPVGFEDLITKLTNSAEKIASPRLTLDTEKPIKVDVSSESLNLSEIVRKGIGSAIRDTITAEVERQLAGRTETAPKGYAAGTAKPEIKSGS